MQTIYFCLEHSAPLLRYSASTPQVGETVVIPELGEKLGTLQVIDVVWEFDAVPHVTCTYMNRESLAANDDLADG